MSKRSKTAKRAAEAEARKREEEARRAREWTSLPGWHLVPGMRTLPDANGRTWRLRKHGPGRGNVEAILEEGPRLGLVPPLPSALLPDLEDPATIGCLEFLTEEITEDPCGKLYPTFGDYEYRWNSFLSAYGKTKPEALLAACRLAERLREYDQLSSEEEEA
jgi:hypothetical protein